jgi:hypothetical protein
MATSTTNSGKGDKPEYFTYWVGRPWKVIDPGDGTSGVGRNDVLVFTGTMEIQCQTGARPGGWGRNCVVTPAGLVGIYGKGKTARSFLVERTGNKLRCKFVGTAGQPIDPATFAVSAGAAKRGADSSGDHHDTPSGPGAAWVAEDGSGQRPGGGKGVA